MTERQRIKNLSVPTSKIDVILDTDAFNEIDDQFAIAYLHKSKQKLNPAAVYAAPFLNHRVSSVKEGMEKSYDEILNLLDIMDEKTPVFKGSDDYLPDEKTPVISPAAKDLAERAKNYSPENPLYVVAIGAITNIASAILLNSDVAENTVVVWLGGNSRHFHDTVEFNMKQDYAAARVVMSSGVPFVQLPCAGVVSSFTLTKPDIDCWLKGNGRLADYLADITLTEMQTRTDHPIWHKVIWDVTAVAWLLNDNDCFMCQRIQPTYLPTYDGVYSPTPTDKSMCYVYHINTTSLMRDLIKKLSI